MQDASRQLDELILASSETPSVMVGQQQQQQQQQPKLKLPPITPVQPHASGQRTPMRSRNGSTSAGTRKQDKFAPLRNMNKYSHHQRGQHQHRHSSQGHSRNQLQHSASQNGDLPGGLLDVTLRDQSRQLAMIRELLDITAKNDRLKDDIWRSLSHLSTQKCENLPVDDDELDDDDDDDECVSDDDDSDKEWTNDEYIPKTNSAMFDKSITNDELKRVLRDYKTYNDNLFSTIKEYQSSFNTIMSSIIKADSTMANDLIEDISLKQEELVVQYDNMAKHWVNSSQKIDTLKSIAKVINNLD